MPLCTRSAVRGTAVTVSLVGTLVGCRNSLSAFGPSGAAARENGEALFRAMALRFTNVARSPAWTRARQKLARGALSPSIVYNDSSVWTAMAGDSARSLTISGRLVGGRYVFAEASGAPVPHTLGDSRHVMHLRKAGDGAFEWTTAVDHAIGGITASELSAALGTVLDAGGGRASAELRADAQRAFPRASAVLGRLFTIDSIASTAAGEAPRTTIVASLHTERLRATAPHFAKYLEKYLVPSRSRVTVRDARGARYLEVAFRNKILTATVRGHRGQLAPLDGPASPMPDTLRLRIGAYAKFGLFTVGASNLDAEAIAIRAPHERGWLLRFRKEPDWHFPIAVATLIRSSLRRPFEREGVLARLAVSDSTGAHTILGRRVHVIVKESAIVRWLGKLGGNAIGELTGRTEAEQDRFVADLFNALAADVRSASATVTTEP